MSSDERERELLGNNSVREALGLPPAPLGHEHPLERLREQATAARQQSQNHSTPKTTDSPSPVTSPPVSPNPPAFDRATTLGIDEGHPVNNLTPTTNQVSPNPKQTATSTASSPSPVFQPLAHPLNFLRPSPSDLLPEHLNRMKRITPVSATMLEETDRLMGMISPEESPL